jgi:N-glycosylase/DNA lyase
VTSVDQHPPTSHAVFPATDYDLAATLTSGQAFRWRLQPGGWEGVIGNHWVRLTMQQNAIHATTARKVKSWDWLTRYLQLDVSLGAVLAEFPDDEPLRQAVKSCRGLRLLRQDPWECLASFILSSTKQIVQIQQIVDLLCQRFGQPVHIPTGHAPAFSFPTAQQLAQAEEAELRICKMGFRAPYLKAAATKVASGDLDLQQLSALPVDQARSPLLNCLGVGQKIADCVLLFAYGFQNAFPVDVWVAKALRQLYFPGQTVSHQQLREFSNSYFGPQAGYAQQYLFHFMRTRTLPRP